MAASRLLLPERKRNYKFALTPLADAMFQLLIFFMLSSSLTPYSLLTLQSAPGGATSAATATAGNDPDAAPQTAAPADAALWTVEAGGVMVGGQHFGFEALAALAEALVTPGTPVTVVLIVRPTAQVQDVTTVLARLRAAGVGSVQISSGGA
jgi:biopolymer transport protein ExbD